VPAAASRPAAVTVAFALQLAAVGTLLLMVGVAIADAIHYDGLIDQAIRITGPDASEAAFERSANLSGALIIAIPAVLMAVWLGIAAVWVRRGSNVARILTLIGLGAPLLLSLLFCLFGGLFGVLMLGLFAASSDDVLADDESFADDEGLAPWDESNFYDELLRLDSGGWSVAFDVLGTTSAAMGALLGIATGILLLTSASNRYFRPQEAMPRLPYPPPYHPAQIHGYPAPHPYPYPPACPYPPAHGHQPFWYAVPAPPSPPYLPWPEPSVAPPTPAPGPAAPPDQPSSPPAG
jgi:hypothetical protein